MRNVLWIAGSFALLLGGCKDPSEQFDGPGGCRRQPVVQGGTRFADDQLSIPIEAMARDESTRPQIVSVDLYADGARVPSPRVDIRPSQGKFGFGQVASFRAPPGVRAVRALLLVHHLNSIFEMNVPFVRDPESRATNKWVMEKVTVREVGTTIQTGPNPPPSDAL